jgi:hypothetical protein
MFATEINNLKDKIGLKGLTLLSVVFFIISINIYHKYLGIYDHIEKRPCSVHIWAQCARASVALNYYKTDMNFFKPHIHKYLNGEGITGLEFPLVNYIPAVLYKLFGFNEAYYRGFLDSCRPFLFLPYTSIDIKELANCICVDLISILFACFRLL